MMRAMPYNLQQGKDLVVEISPKWKNLDQFQQNYQQEKELKIISEGVHSKATSSVESEPTSTLDTTRRSPSPPTSTSTLSSSFPGNGSKNLSDGVADPAATACASPSPQVQTHLHNGPNSHISGSGGGGERCSGGGGSGIGLEEWDSMFPNGEGALLPWIMGEQEDAGVGLKHLLQSGVNPSSFGLEYEGNAGLGVVDQGSAGLDSLSSLPMPLSAALHPASVGSCSNGLSLNPGHLVGSMPMSFPQHFDVGGDEKPQIFNPQLVMNQHQAHGIANSSFLMSPSALGYCHKFEQFPQPQAKRHNPGVVLDPNLAQIAKNPFLDQGGGGGHHEMLLRKQQLPQSHQLGMQHLPMGLPPQLVPPHLQQQKAVMVPKGNQFPMSVHQQQQQLQEQGVKDQLFKAADLIQTGNFSLAQEILARLNHQLSLPAKPLIRAAFYVKEALLLLLQLGNPVAGPPPLKTLTPYDVFHKMNAYKVFSEVSPIPQFVNFTCTQAILEALDDYDVIHIIDFDIGCGAQWASLIQELPLRKRGAPSLKITAIAPLSPANTLELSLIRENLVQFANDIGVAFELQVVNLDSLDPSSSSLPNVRTSENESIAVCLPIWSFSTRPSVFPAILRFIKQQSPKILVSLDRGFERCDVPFPQHLIHTLESWTNFLDSVDDLNVASDIVTKVEKFFVQPRIENTVLGRVHAPDKMPHWKSLFNSAGLVPVQFSNFTETQADYVVKRTPGRGFHVEKRQASLVLSWQRCDLVAASAWRC